ncbi:hypothetical protein BGZ60DRAFT_419194 [Tricladium varicosporioides]|nr:hypothetical protein BGZ60DRAFT_419194 [Hymenoscyphus varicosporioides]
MAPLHDPTLFTHHGPSPGFFSQSLQRSCGVSSPTPFYIHSRIGRVTRITTQPCSLIISRPQPLERALTRSQEGASSESQNLENVRFFQRRQNQLRSDVIVTSNGVIHNIEEIEEREALSGEITQVKTDRFNGTNYIFDQALLSMCPAEKKRFWLHNTIDIVVSFAALDKINFQGVSIAAKERLVTNDQRSLLWQLRTLGPECVKFAKYITVSIKFDDSFTNDDTQPSWAGCAANPVHGLIGSIINHLKSFENMKTFDVKLIVPRYDEATFTPEANGLFITYEQLYYALPFYTMKDKMPNYKVFQQNGMSGQPKQLRGELKHHLNRAWTELCKENKSRKPRSLPLLELPQRPP